MRFYGRAAESPAGSETKLMARTDWYCEEVLSGDLEVARIFEDDLVLAFHHPRPSAVPHVVVIPKDHVPSLLDQKAVDGALLTSMLRAIQHVAVTLGLDGGDGFYIRANAAAPGVTPHMHWHVLPGAGACWPEMPDGSV
jgi:histidine triad (HIT) family protein